MAPTAWATPEARTVPPLIAGIAGRVPAVIRTALNVVIARGCSALRKLRALHALRSHVGAFDIAVTVPSADGVDKAVTALSEVNAGLEVNAWLEVTVWLDETVVVVSVEAMEFARIGDLRDLIAAVAAIAESESIFIGFGRPCLDGRGGGSSTISEEAISFCDPSLSFKDFLLVSHSMPDGLEWS